MHPMVLKLDVSGLPVKWITWETAATAYARGRVKWEAGSETFTVRGGTRGGQQSIIEINSIIAVADRNRHFSAVPRLTNEALFARDHHTCLYCGKQFPPRRLSLDHIRPVAMQGETVWTNAATACVPCNQRKGCKSLEAAGMKLLAVPFVPNLAESLILKNRNVLADQSAFLAAFGSNRPAPRKAH